MALMKAILLLLLSATFLVHSTSASPFHDEDEHLSAKVMVGKAPIPAPNSVPTPVPVVKQPPPPPPQVKKPTPAPVKQPPPVPAPVKQPPPVVTKPTPPVPVPAPAPVVTKPTPAPVVKKPTPPSPAPARPPLAPVRSKADCGPLCVGRCKLHSRKKVCMRACVTCCDRCKCVPPGTYGNREMCGTCYTDMTSHGKKNKCP